MIKELCDICLQPVGEIDSTRIVLKDYKGLSFGSFGEAEPSKRKWKGVICDKCLEAFRNKAGEQE